jgi:hypothetical protein
MRSVLPGFGHLRAGRPAGEVGFFYREERRSLQTLSEGISGFITL